MCENARNLQKILDVCLLQNRCESRFSQTWGSDPRLPDNGDLSTPPVETLETFLTSPTTQYWNNTSGFSSAQYVAQEDRYVLPRAWPDAVSLPLSWPNSQYLNTCAKSTLECSRVEWVIVHRIWPLLKYWGSHSCSGGGSVLFQELDVIILSKCEATPSPHPVTLPHYPWHHRYLLALTLSLLRRLFLPVPLKLNAIYDQLGCQPSHWFICKNYQKLNGQSLRHSPITKNINIVFQE